MCEIMLTPFVLRQIVAEYYRWQDHRLVVQFALADEDGDPDIIDMLVNAEPVVWEAVKRVVIDGTTWTVVQDRSPRIERVEHDSTPRLAAAFHVVEEAPKPIFRPAKRKESALYW